MTPNDIEVFIHYHGCYLPHPRIDAPAVRESTDMLLKLEMIKPGRKVDTYLPTEGGNALMKLLCDVEIPTKIWVDRDGNKI